MKTVSRHTDHSSVLSEEGADLHAVMDRTPCPSAPGQGYQNSPGVDDTEGRTAMRPHHAMVSVTSTQGAGKEVAGVGELSSGYSLIIHDSFRPWNHQELSCFLRTSCYTLSPCSRGNNLEYGLYLKAGPLNSRMRGWGDNTKTNG